jgi:hypothetical protein
MGGSFNQKIATVELVSEGDLEVSEKRRHRR